MTAAAQLVASIAPPVQIMGVTLPTDPRFIDHTNVVFGRWTVLRYDGKRTGRDHYWFCRCECGVERSVAGVSLARGASKSCGCLKEEMIRSGLSATHGHSRITGHSKVYRTWAHIKERTSNPKIKNWHNYGGRGIRMHPAWAESFEVFLAAVGHPPSDKHSIDRYPNNNGNYEPDNVRWATAKEQARNTRTVTLNDELVTEIHALRADGLTISQIAKKINRHRKAVSRVVNGKTWLL